MSRSSWKLNYLPKAILKLKKSKQQNNLCVWSRSAVIPSFLLDKIVKVHTGKEFKAIKITQEKIGYKFGEFVLTRKPYTYKGKKKVVKK
jgi:small subunit ribosomal protein S19